MSWLRESDVLSQPAKKAGNTDVISWLEKHQNQCYTSSIVIAQLAFWVRSKNGKQHQLRIAVTPMPVEDSYIAAIARRHNLTIVTGNVQDFSLPGIKVFDPIARNTG